MKYCRSTIIEEAASTRNDEEIPTGIKIITNITRNNSRKKRHLSSSWKQVGDDMKGQEEYGRFGSMLSISSDGNRLAIGAPSHDGDVGQWSGCVKVLDFIDDQWTQVGQDIVGENENDASGSSLSLSADGSRLAIGSPKNSDQDQYTGHVRVYEFQNDEWVQIGSNINGEGSFDQSGSSVSLSSNGSILAIGAPENDVISDGLYDSGHVRIFNFDGSQWNQMGNDINGKFGVGCPEREIGGFAGLTIALSANGLKIALSDKYVVRVLKYDGEFWTQVGDDIEQNHLNIDSVSISSYGNRLVLGTSGHRQFFNQGFVQVYEYADLKWQQMDEISGNGLQDRLGSSVSISGNGKIIIAGAIAPAGKGYIQALEFDRSSSTWNKLGEEVGDAVGDQFGSIVALNNDGTRVAVGAPYHDAVGLVRVFQIQKCYDSPFRFRITKADGKRMWQDCAWAKKKSTNWRCQMEGVSTMCPFTCNQCDECVDSTSRMKFFKTPDAKKKIAQSCSWTSKRPRVRCLVEGMEYACRKTCKMC
jgi:hypothetical protein